MLKIIRNHFDYVGEKDLDDIIEKLALKIYLPVLNVEYQRVLFRDSFGQNIRITFDYNIRCGPSEMFDRECKQYDLRVLAPNFEVLEIKYGNSLPI